MTSKYPVWLERWWIPQAARIFRSPADALPMARIEKAAAELGDLFTTERPAGFGGYAGKPELLAAYALVHFPRTFLAVRHVLAELTRVRNWRPAGRLAVADLGCGLGAAAAAVAGHFQKDPDVSEVALAAVDSHKESLALCAALFAGCAAHWPKTRLQAVPGDLRRATELAAGRHLVVAAFSVNEAFRASEGRGPDVSGPSLVQWAKLVLSRLAPGGVLLLVEPARRESAEHLASLREAAVREGFAGVLAPCPHEGACPMASSGKDRWCHEVRTWQPTPMMQHVNRHLYRSLGEVKYSFLALRRPGLPSEGAGEEDVRLVSPVLHAKGRYLFTVCAPAGRLVECAIQVKDLNSCSEAALKRLERGDWLRVTPPVDPEASPGSLHRLTDLEPLAPPSAEAD